MDAHRGDRRVSHRSGREALTATHGETRGSGSPGPVLLIEPAAAIVDRYATADIELGGAPIRRGELVRVSIAGANRDPAVFADPDRFDVRRSNARRHLAFAHGPHACIGTHLARLEARTALTRLLSRTPQGASPTVRRA